MSISNLVTSWQRPSGATHRDSIGRYPPMSDLKAGTEHVADYVLG
ncbi:MAG: hypothetical protein QOF84_4455, partial [Streptomyces sp.]|nr:hypothetical protein [Streptomyces sp.]